MSNESAMGAIGNNIRERIVAQRREADLILETCDAVEDAWTDWDVVSLLQMRYITPREAEVIEREMREDGITEIVVGDCSLEGLPTTVWALPSAPILTFSDN